MNTKMVINGPDITNGDDIVIKYNGLIIQVPFLKNVENTDFYIKKFLHTLFFVNMKKNTIDINQSLISREDAFWFFINTNKWLNKEDIIKTLNKELNLIYKDYHIIKKDYINYRNKKYWLNEELYKKEYKPYGYKKKSLIQSFKQDLKGKETEKIILDCYKENKYNEYLTYEKISSLKDIKVAQVKRILNKNNIYLKRISPNDERLFYYFDYLFKYDTRPPLKNICNYIGCDMSTLKRFFKKNPYYKERFNKLTKYKKVIKKNNQEYKYKPNDVSDYLKNYNSNVVKINDLQKKGHFSIIK